MIEERNNEELLNERQEQEFLKLIDKKISFKPNFDAIRNKIEYDNKEVVEKKPVRSRFFSKKFSVRFAVGFCSLALVLVLCIVIIKPRMNIKDANSNESLVIEKGDYIYSDNITYQLIDNDELAIVNVNEYAQTLIIPSQYQNYKVTKISSLNSTKLIKLEIPSTVNNIDVRNIKCTNLCDIAIDENNEVYDSRDHCDAIILKDSNTLVKGCNYSIIPNTVKVIGDYAFSHTNIKNISIPNTVKIIRNNAFESCEKLESVNIGSGVVSIGIDCFSSCLNLNKITISSDNKFFDSRNNCNAIIETRSNKLIVGCFSTIIPTNVVEIGSDAFAYCKNLRRITIPKSVKYIDNCAFYGCNYLEEVNMNNGVTTISYGAFYYCNSLETINYNGTSEELANIKMGVLNISQDINFRCEGELS